MVDRLWLFNPGGATEPCCADEEGDCTRICLHVVDGSAVARVGARVVMDDAYVGVTDGSGNLCVPIDGPGTYVFGISQAGVASEEVTVTIAAGDCPDDPDKDVTVVLDDAPACTLDRTIVGCNCNLVTVAGSDAVAVLTVDPAAQPLRTFYGVPTLVGFDYVMRFHLPAGYCTGSDITRLEVFHPLFAPYNVAGSSHPGTITLLRPDRFNQWCYIGNPYGMCDIPDSIFATFGPAGWTGALQGNTFVLPRTSFGVDAVTWAACIPNGTGSITVQLGIGAEAGSCNPVPAMTCQVVFWDLPDCVQSAGGGLPTILGAFGLAPDYGTIFCPVNLKMNRSGAGTPPPYILFYE